MHIERSTEEEIPLINSIIESSKRYWDYSESYLQAAIPLIQIDASWLQERLGYSIFDSKELIGFLGVEEEHGSWTLEHLWVSPNRIRSGVGRMAIDFIMKEAKMFDVAMIYLLPDPPAEGFYLRQGARLTGKVVQSRVKDGPLFHQMVFKI